MCHAAIVERSNFPVPEWKTGEKLKILEAFFVEIKTGMIECFQTKS